MTLKPKNIYLFLCTLVFATILSQLFLDKPVIAETLTSPNYQLQWGNFNMTSGKKSSTNYTLTDTVGQNAPGLFSSSGYKLKSGFQYIYDTFIDFSFQIDDLAIELGTLVPNVGSTDTNIITVSTPSGNGYQIMVHQNHPLRLNSGTTIPDTTCDAGSCSETTSGVWTNSDVYGFGFNTIGINSSGTPTGIGTSNYFTDQTYYRQFADFSKAPSETNQIIMSENNAIENRQAKITYKANISPAQSSGQYENVVTFIAVPKY